MMLYRIKLISWRTPTAACVTKRRRSSPSSTQMSDEIRQQIEQSRTLVLNADYTAACVTNRRRSSPSSTQRSDEIRQEIEQSRTLVLNADYTPLAIAPLSLLHWKDALRAIYLGKATVVSAYEDLSLRSVSVSFPLPSVIALKTYQHIPSTKPILTRRNILLRDGFKCCYCGAMGCAENTLTLDHVTPKSKGGKSEVLTLTLILILT